jgi:hypothetical protein
LISLSSNPPRRSSFDSPAGGDDHIQSNYTESAGGIQHPTFAEAVVSIVRVGMAEDSKFGDGYEAIFGKEKPGGKMVKKPAAKKAAVKKSAAPKGSTKKK